MRNYLLASLLCLSTCAFAQTSTYDPSDAPVRKDYNEWLYQFSPRIDLLLKDNRTSFYLEGLVNYKYEYASLIENYRWNIKLGIDYAASKTWYVGMSARMNDNSSGVYNYCTRLYVQHRGKIGSMLFSQELLYEQFNFADNTTSTTTSSGIVYSRRPAEGRVCIGVGLGRYFETGENKIAVFASYRPYIQFDFKNDDVSYYKDRFFDYTCLRIDAGYLIKNQFYVGLYASRDTNFYYAASSPPNRVNTITPIIGLSCNILIFAGADKETLGSDGFKYFYTR